MKDADLEPQRADDPEARVWRGGGETDLPLGRQGVVVLGTPLGHPAFIHAHLEKKVEAGLSTI